MGNSEFGFHIIATSLLIKYFQGINANKQFMSKQLKAIYSLQNTARLWARIFFKCLTPTMIQSL